MASSAVKSIICTACILAFLGITPVMAFDEIKSKVPEAKKVGDGRLSYIIWDVYDAALFAPEGEWKKTQPYALQLSYLRDLKGKKIANRSIEEMRALGITDEMKLATWHAQMDKIFPDVKEGDVLTGIHTRSGNSVFYKNGKKIGQINDSEFSAAFFGIWLDEKTSAPELRKKLLGVS